uniref:Uncharacterized protein n=1 Tax=Denticeps clupeoides TaxID=299321 RepID=A0AAY4CWG7_9TELE
MTWRERAVVFLVFCALVSVPIAILLGFEGLPQLFRAVNATASPVANSTASTPLPVANLITPSALMLRPSRTRTKRSSSSCGQLAPRVKSTDLILCIPSNSSYIATLPWSAFPFKVVHRSLGRAHHRVEKVMPGQFKTDSWYLTLGGTYGEWSWKNLVAETPDDWSSYSTADAVLWRKNVTLAKLPKNDGLLLTITAGVFPHLTQGCRLFLLAPWKVPIELSWQVAFCQATEPRPTVLVNQVTSAVATARMAADPLTADDIFQIVYGASGNTNNWLLLAEQAAADINSDCIVCLGPRPLLKVVPAPLNQTCMLSLMNSIGPPQICTSLLKYFPRTSNVTSHKPPYFSSDVAPNNFTCVNLTGNTVPLGCIDITWCTEIVKMQPGFRPIPRADLWWYCGGRKLYDGFPLGASGTCALVSLLLPVSVTAVDFDPQVGRRSQFPGRSKRSIIPGSAYNPTYIDAIGVPRGVPNEYKLVNQVATGFENIPLISAFFPITPNKNVDRINYIHFNVQLLANFTRDGLAAVHEQLSATSLMAFQNRIAVDLLLAEKGGVCSIFGKDCCTFIPNNTSPDGSLTKAITGLTALTTKMKEHSGVNTEMWDAWLDMFGTYKTLVVSVLISIAVFTAILVTCGCCCIPCIRALLTRLIVTALTPEGKDPSLQLPLLTCPSAPPPDASDDEEGVLWSHV